MNDKECVALRAVEQVNKGMLVGLGTGSTADYFIEALARRNHSDGLDVKVVASSLVSTLKAQEMGLSVVSLEHIGQLDIYVDGADEVTPEMTLLKGRGYDLVREKLLAHAADVFMVLVDDSKLVQRIGDRFPIPVEVMPFAWQMVKRSIEDLGGKAQLRRNAANDGWAITSYGSLVLDISFEPELDAGTINTTLNALPGVVEHGIFIDLADAVFIGTKGQVEERWSDEKSSR